MAAVLKIILMYPNFKWDTHWEERTIWKLHPYNLCLLSAMVDKYYDVKIIDANTDNLSKDKFAEIIKLERPDILGISVLTNEYGNSGIVAAQIAKEINPNIKTIFGGVHAISDPYSIIKHSWVDYVVFGEGEYVFRELCDYFNGNGKLPQKGILYKRGGEIVNTGRADFIEDLDALPLPSYHKIDFLKYANERQREAVDGPREFPYAHIFTSRGCPFNCCFCQVGNISGKKPRCRSPENIVEEIEFLIENYGIKSLEFNDDNLLIDKMRAQKLFQLMIDKGFNLKWNANTLAIYLLDEELIGLMKMSGCQYANVAIESGVERVLKDIIHKPLDLGHAKQMVKKLKEAGIDCAVNFILGFPGESWAEIRQTIKFAEELDADYTKMFIATPLPNTELYGMAKRDNLLNQGFSFDKHLWTDGFIETKEFRPQDLKILRAYEWDRLNFSTPKKRNKVAKMMGVSNERLEEIRKATFIRANP